MNLVEILRSRVADLPDGDYIVGLKAVLQHIEVAESHLERGKAANEETAFTDAIYRTNQAFEGSLKEAYRVLAEKDPAKESPHYIESYFQQHNLLRPRVLAQLTNYRREWRNPSTHDYRLDFDEDEALLAIVTVSVFATVLVDQITERISYNKAKVVASEHPSPSPAWEPLLEQLYFHLELFVLQFAQTHIDKSEVREVEVLGALAGFLSAAAPELSIATAEFEHDKTKGADFYIESPENERLILELKLRRPTSSSTRDQTTFNQMASYMEATGADQGVLFFYTLPNSGQVQRQELSLPDNRHLLIVTTI
jgi:hypothetical protein